MEAGRQRTSAGHVYSLCCFGRDWVVPVVQFLDAESDRDALDLAGSINPWLRREVWDRHRLVSVLPPTC